MFHLTVSLTGTGYHPASWRVSGLPVGPNAAAVQAMARTAERGHMDAILLGLPSGAAKDPGAANTLRLDPLPLLGSLIGVTRRIGLGAVWDMDFTEPFHVARVFATLDHLSYGRTAWVARMFESAALEARIGRSSGVDDLNTYCQRAGEFVDVVKKLLDSWEDEAFALDKASGMFVDPDRVHPIHHRGEFFSVRGPLNVPRPPQGHPVIVQLDSAVGKAFNAANADVILTSCETLSLASARYRDLRAAAAGRDLRILANVVLVLGETESEAWRRSAALNAMLPVAGGGLYFVGTPEQLVEILAIWSETACDGFNLLPAVLPDDLDLLVDAVILLAQRRGLFRTEYRGETLRNHLKLPRPHSQYTTPVTEAAGP
jgi:N-acetyl-S-(2-succino)cysteine monooxygenase